MKSSSNLTFKIYGKYCLGTLKSRIKAKCTAQTNEISDLSVFCHNVTLSICCSG